MKADQVFHVKEEDYNEHIEQRVSEAKALTIVRAIQLGATVPIQGTRPALALIMDAISKQLLYSLTCEGEHTIVLSMPRHNDEIPF